MHRGFLCGTLDFSVIAFLDELETPALSKHAPHENPLVPNQKLRQIYTRMVEMQVLDRHVVRLQSRLKGNHPFTSIEGQEACRASTAVGLAAGDLVSHTQKSAAMNLAYGVNHGSLLRHIDAVFSETKDASATVVAAATRQLPWIADSEEQMSLALGAALAFRTLKQSHLVMAYLHRTDLSRKQWAKALKLAGKLELPIVFIVLPAAPDDRMNLCAMARRAGLPGIPVDANDVVALYRVAQESIGRARAGDGPVLMECLVGLPGNAQGEPITEAIAHMREYLVGRRICTRPWAESAGKTLRRKIAARK